MQPARLSNGVNVKSGVKEETMKKFIYITVVFMLMLISIGCATTPEQRKDTYDMRKDVGNSQFVGSTRSNQDAVGMTKNIYW